LPNVQSLLLPHTVYIETYRVRPLSPLSLSDTPPNTPLPFKLMGGPFLVKDLVRGSHTLKYEQATCTFVQYIARCTIPYVRLLPYVGSGFADPSIHVVDMYWQN
jgi:hypothetical protein